MFSQEMLSAKWVLTQTSPLGRHRSRSIQSLYVLPRRSKLFAFPELLCVMINKKFTWPQHQKPWEKKNVFPQTTGLFELTPDPSDIFSYRNSLGKTPNSHSFRALTPSSSNSMKALRSQLLRQTPPQNPLPWGSTYFLRKMLDQLLFRSLFGSFFSQNAVDALRKVCSNSEILTYICIA